MRHMGTLCTTCRFLAGETRRSAYTSKTCLFSIKLQFAHIWTSLVPPHPPPPFICERSAKKTRFPNVASSLKVSWDFNSEKSEAVLAQWCISGRPSPLVYNPLRRCNYWDHQQREATLILQLCCPVPWSDGYRVLLRPSYPWRDGGRGIYLWLDRHRLWDCTV